MSRDSLRHQQKQKRHTERMRKQSEAAYQKRMARIEQHEQRKREVCPRSDKVIFHTWAKAEKARDNMRKRGEDVRGLNPYWCKCGKVHLGHGRAPGKRKK